ncbi:MAG: recombinase family protein [Oscillospiraceae bacterium]|nr:recombinase family protein [Oscillospiraceae bacterium]
MTVAIYARKSVDRQDSVSIDTQIEDCKTRVPKGANIRIYQDEGFSGKNTDRPDLQRMIDDIGMKLIQIVIVYKLDRISRNTVDFYSLYGFMESHDCEFICVHDGFDTTTREGKVCMGLLAIFAELERENVALRVKDSYYFRARTDGRFLGGREPFAYTRGKNSNGKSTLIPNENMQLVVDFYHKYCEDTNTSLHKLVAYAREHYNVKLSATQVRNILSNPLYVKSDKRLYDFYKLKGVQFLNDIEQFDGAMALQIVNKTDQTKSKPIFNDTTKWIAYLANWNGVIDSRTFIIVQERLSQNKSYASSNITSADKDRKARDGGRNWK